MAKSKYHARKVKRHGMIFDSRKEADRWDELVLLQRAGKITGLRRQVPFQILPTQRRPVWNEKKNAFIDKAVKQKVTYIADFVYIDSSTGNEVVEDAKGYRTREYILKSKMMLYFHNILIKEV